jgi:TolA-binding protein
MAQQAEMQQGQAPPVAVPVLSDAEIARIHKIFDAAYTAFHGIETEYPHTAIAQQARGEILVMVSHWRTLGRFSDSARLAERFLGDRPTDLELPKIRLDIARDLLAYASKPIEDQLSKQAMLSEVAQRFATAHAALQRIIKDFADEKTYVQQAQWDIANSYLTRARVVSGFSATLARGQYVRAARQLERIADEYYDHPNIGQIPQMLATIAQEMFGKGFFDEAVVVWTEVTVRWPTHGLAHQAARQIAQAYENQLNQPLRAAEVYQELNFARGGDDVDLQNSIYNIGVKLKDERRWVEALHVLETFVDTFPRHPNAGQTLTLVGEIHQANEAWKDAIAAYERAINEYNSGDFVKSAKWAIAECKINLSGWQEAIDAYRDYIQAYAQDPQAQTATARIEILKDLASYQKFVDEKGQRKADDAQFQIARIVHEQLSNPVKAIIEYQKVAENWPQSHLADDALYTVGTIYVSLESTEKARQALRTVAEKYPSSSLADDALFLVGKSFEDESQKLATVTRSESLERAKDFAQKRAYELAQLNKRRQRDVQQQKISALKQAGKAALAENEAAFSAAQAGQFDMANVSNFARQADQEVETLTAAQLADREDKINAALRRAVAAYKAASQVAAGDKAAEALLRMAKIYDEQLKDSDAAVATWKEIVRQFSGTSVAEDASWRIAQYYERSGEHAQAIEALEAFLRNYRRSPNAGPAQAAIAENYERLGEWIKAMDAYTNYLNNYPDGAFAKKAKDRISWIKTYRL